MSEINWTEYTEDADQYQRLSPGDMWIHTDEYAAWASGGAYTNAPEVWLMTEATDEDGDHYSVRLSDGATIAAFGMLEVRQVIGHRASVVVDD